MKWTAWLLLAAVLIGTILGTVLVSIPLQNTAHPPGATDADHNSSVHTTLTQYIYRMRKIDPMKYSNSLIAGRSSWFLACLSGRQAFSLQIQRGS